MNRIEFRRTEWLARLRGMDLSRATRWFRLALLLALLTALSKLHGQQPQFPNPRLTSVMPAGGKAGSTVEVTLAGVDLDEVSALLFDHPGFKAEKLPPPAKPAEPEKGKPKAAPPPSPVRFKVTIAPDTPVGIYDLRIVGQWGVSNPRAFVVGDLAEIVEAEPNSDVPQAQPLEINTVANGTIGSNTDVDYYVFSGKKGQRVVLHCAASSIDSRLSPLIEVYGSDDRLLGKNRHYRNRDAVLDVVPPDDGKYLVRLCEHGYLGGGPEHFYRLKITAAPWIDAAYPPVVEPGKATTITLHGRNLPGGKPDPTALLNGRPLEKLVVQVTPPAGRPDNPGLAYRGTLLPRSGGLDGFEYRLRNPAGASNPVLLSLARAPIILDNEDNSLAEKPQEITLPCELCGRIEKLRDRDRYLFTARQGEIFVLEGYADRLGAPLDLYFEIRREADKQVIGEFDDNSDIPTTVNRFFTRTEDPRARFVAPADGRYELLVASRGAFSQASPRHVYRLSIHKEQPDFRLVLVGNNDLSGAGCTVRQGGSQHLQVVCFRQDGFAGEVELSVDQLPPGTSCPRQVLGPGQRDTVLVITAAPDAPAGERALRVQGKALIDGKPVVREARAGCIVWPAPQPNLPAISRLGHSLWVGVREKGPFRLEMPVAELSALVGSNVSLKVTVQRHWPDFKAPVQITRLSAPQQGNGQPINIPNVNATGQTADIKFQIAKDTPPGVYNLVFLGTAQVPFNKDPTDKRKVNVPVAEASPPVRLTVFNAVAELTLPAPNVTLKPGGEAAVVVKANRLYGYKGDFKVQLVVPQGLQGVTAGDATIPAGAGEARLVLKAAANAKLGTNPSFLVRATASVDKVPVTHETKLTITISKDGAAAGETKAVKLLTEATDGWRYLPIAQLKGDAWRTLDFDDKAWLTGKAPLGDGEEEIGKRKGTTVANAAQPFAFRRSFDLPAELLAQKGVSFRLAVASDDSADVYINGQLADQDPEADHEFRYWNREVELPAKQLRPGRNVVAVLVKNKSGSSDLYFDLEVTALVPVKSASPK